MSNGRQVKIETYGAAYDVLTAAIAHFPRDMWQYRSPVELWTIHEVLVHITDSEANSFIRLRRLIARPELAVLA